MRLLGSSLVFCDITHSQWRGFFVLISDDVPLGWRWATTAEVLAEAPKCTERHEAYANQCGWRGHKWPATANFERIGFICRDSLVTEKVRVVSWPVFLILRLISVHVALGKFLCLHL